MNECINSYMLQCIYALNESSMLNRYIICVYIPLKAMLLVVIRIHCSYTYIISYG